MKQLTLILVALCILCIYGCNPNKPATNYKPFFDYDEIDYYFNNYDEENLPDLYNNQSKSLLDSIKAQALLYEKPENINDTLFISNLEKVGYAKYKIKGDMFKYFNEIFCEKPATNIYATACIYVYRDILIFRKKGKVTGLAKICFGCSAYHFAGAHGNTATFGVDDDYVKLRKLLYN